MRASLVRWEVVAVVLLLASISAAQSGDFTIIALPDTQNESQFSPAALTAQTEWIQDNRDALNIQMVLGEGDIVNDFSDPAQQQSSDTAFKILDNAGIPYMLAIGNHDYDNENPKGGRLVNGFNRFFGPARYAGRDYYRGNFPAGSNENFYGVVNIGGQDFLFLILEFMPRAESVAWAESVLQANPDKQVIVVTHSFLNVDGTRVDSCDTEDMPPGNSTGDDLWAVLRKYPNVSMVLNGHLTDGQAAHRSDIADNGNLVNQIFANYQTLANGGDGWLRIITFHPSSNSISVQTFSPFLHRFKTDDNNQFKLFYHNPHRQTGAGTLSGMVRSVSDCTPIAGATVSINGRSTTTNAKGRYSLSVPPGSYQVTVSGPVVSGGEKSETVADSFDTDLNFFLIAAPSAPATETLNMSISPGHATISAGQSASFALKVSSDGSVSEPVTFSCSGLPAGASCGFDPVSIKPANLPATTKLKISTTAQAAMFRTGRHRTLPNLLWAAALVPGLLLMGSGYRRRHQPRRLLFGLVALCLVAVLVAGCQGSGGATTTNGTAFAVTVTASSGGFQKSSTISLNLQ